MTGKDDPVRRAVARHTLPVRIAREVAAGVERLHPQGMFGPEFYAEVRRQAAQWRSLGVAAGKLGVLLPIGYFAAAAGYQFPDLDIVHLGIGSHRYVLYHSGLAVWLLRKVHQAALAYVGSARGGLADLVVRKMVGVALGAGAFGVGVHLLVDAFDPKAVIFPFFGSLLDGTLVEDRVWLLANAVWCFRMSKELFVLALGEEMGLVKEKVLSCFEPAAKEGVHVVSGGLG